MNNLKTLIYIITLLTLLWSGCTSNIPPSIDLNISVQEIKDQIRISKDEDVLVGIWSGTRCGKNIELGIIRNQTEATRCLYFKW